MIAAETTEAAMSGTLIFWALFASIGLVVLNGFYVAYEFALLAAKRASFEGERDRRGTFVNRSARASLSDLSMQLAGAQLGITLASLALGRIGEPAFEALIEPVIGSYLAHDVAVGVSFTASLALFTFLHLVFGEMVPKNIALAAPDATLRWLVVPYRFYLLLFRPIVLFLNGISNLGVRVFGIEPRDELLSVHTPSELAAIVAHSREGGAIEADDAEMLHGAIDFARRTVSEIAIPIDGVASIHLGSSAIQLERIVAESEQDRILVFDSRSSNAEPIGYLHVRVLLDIENGQRSAPIPGTFVRKMAVVHGDRSLIETLRLLRRVRKQLAVVHLKDNEGNQKLAIVSVEQVVRALLRDPSAPVSETASGIDSHSVSDSGSDSVFGDSAGTL